MQLDLPLYEKELSEEQEIISLVQLAKEGDDYAYDRLLLKYKDLITGKFVRNIIRPHLGSLTNDDVTSTLNLIFVESVRSLNPSKAKLSTHFINTVRFRFYDYILKDRLIPVYNNKTTSAVKQMVEKTTCIPLEKEVAENLICANVSDEPSEIRITIEGVNYPIKKDVFINKYMKERILSLADKKEATIYRTYIELTLAQKSGPIDRLVKRFKVPKQKIYKIIRKCEELIKLDFFGEKNA